MSAKKIANRGNSSIYAYRAQTSHTQEEKADAIRTKNKAIGDEENTHTHTSEFLVKFIVLIFLYSYSEYFYVVFFTSLVGLATNWTMQLQFASPDTCRENKNSAQPQTPKLSQNT